MCARPRAPAHVRPPTCARAQTDTDVAWFVNPYGMLKSGENGRANLLSQWDAPLVNAGVFDAHRAMGCGAQPRFSVDQVGGVSMLSCRCAACGYYEIVV